MLNKGDVLHIARLAHLDLSDTEVEKFSAQLSDVLELFSKIDGLDLKDEAETSQITGLENVFRADEIKKYSSGKIFICSWDKTCWQPNGC